MNKPKSIREQIKYYLDHCYCTPRLYQITDVDYLSMTISRVVRRIIRERVGNKKRSVSITKKRIIINREELIAQITERLHNSASPENVFKVGNLLLNTRLSIKDHVLVSRI